MADCCLIKKVATVEVYENKNEVRAYGFMAGDRNTPVMEVRFKHLWGESNLSNCKLRWIIVDDVGSLLVGEVPIQSDNTALINLPNALFTGDRRMKVQLTVASCDGERILNLQQFTDLKVVNGLVTDEVVEPVYQLLINQLYDDTKNYLSQLESSYNAKYGSLETLYANSKASLEQYLITAENGGNAEFLQGYSPAHFQKVENTINDLIASTKYSVGDVVEVLGYYTKGDGAGHQRQKKPEGYNGTDAVIGVDGSVWGIVHNGEVNVSWFGAKGNGITDDTVAIQKALLFSNSVGDLNKLYYIESNISESTNTLSNIKIKLNVRNTISFKDINSGIFKNIEIYRESTITDPTDRGVNHFVFDNCENIELSETILRNASGSFITMNACNNINVSHLSFYRSNQTAPNSGGNGYGIILQGCKKIKIHECLFKDIQRHSIYMSLKDWDTFNIWCEDIIVSNCSFEGNREGDFNATGFEQQVKIMSANNVICNNNKFIGCVGAFLLDEKTKDSTIEAVPCNILISNNIVVDCKNDKRNSLDSGILFYAPTIPTHLTINPKNINIVNNMIIGKTISISNYAISLGRGDNITIESNTIEHTGTTTHGLLSVYYDLTERSLGKISITGNNLKNSKLIVLDSKCTIDKLDIIKNIVNCSDENFECINIKPTSILNEFILTGNYLYNFQRVLYLRIGSIGRKCLIANNNFCGSMLNIGDTGVPFSSEVEFYGNKNYTLNTREIKMFEIVLSEKTNSNEYYKKGHTATLSTPFFKTLSFSNGANFYATNLNQMLTYNNGKWFKPDGLELVVSLADKLSDEYYVEEMKSRGIYGIYEEYAKNVHEYEKYQNVQSDSEIMNLNVLQPPTIPLEVEEYAKEYNLI